MGRFVTIGNVGDAGGHLDPAGSAAKMFQARVYRVAVAEPAQQLADGLWAVTLVRAADDGDDDDETPRSVAQEAASTFSVFTYGFGDPQSSSVVMFSIAPLERI